MKFLLFKRDDLKCIVLHLHLRIAKRHKYDVCYLRGNRVRGIPLKIKYQFDWYLKVLNLISYFGKQANKWAKIIEVYVYDRISTINYVSGLKN